MAEETTTTENTNTDNTYKGATKQQIAAWKLKYTTGVHQLTAIHPTDKTEHICYLRQPGLVDVQRAMASDKRQVGTFNESIFTNCLLDCDPLIKTTDSLMMGIYGQLGDLIEVAEVSIKKL